MEGVSRVCEFEHLRGFDARPVDVGDAASRNFSPIDHQLVEVDGSGRRRVAGLNVEGVERSARGYVGGAHGLTPLICRLRWASLSVLPGATEPPLGTSI